MRIDILTLFPDMFIGMLSSSIVKKALMNKKIEIHLHDFREFSNNKHKKVDDYPYGGGAGMVIQVQPIVDCIRAIPRHSEAKKILTSPVGKTYHQTIAKDYATRDHLIVICGHYEGIDERIVHYVDEVISIGDYILTGGEIAAMAIVDSVVRLQRDVLGNNDSIVEESFEELLEYPQYTRPDNMEGHIVPEVLLSGNHEEIAMYRRKEALKRTLQYRPDLLDKATLTKKDQKMLDDIKKETLK